MTEQKGRATEFIEVVEIHVKGRGMVRHVYIEDYLKLQREYYALLEENERLRDALGDAWKRIREGG